MIPSPRQDVAALAGYHSPQVDVDIRLNTNESPFPPPTAWVEAVAKAATSIDWHRYPDRSATELRRALGEVHARDADWVFAANGSNEVLQCLLLAYGGAGRSVAVFEPTYALHSHIARITGTAVLSYERTADFALDPAEVARAVAEQPVITFLCSPNNPTGVVEPEGVVRDVLASVEAAGGLLVVDEAYGQFAPWSATSLLGEEVPLVVTRTFSKTWSMAAARLGYLLGPPSVVADLDKVTLPYHLDGFKQLAGTLALGYQDEMDGRVATVVEERGRVESALGRLDVDVWPSGSNFILFRPRRADGGSVWQELLDRSVLIRNCSSWSRLEGCLRVTIGTPEENDRFLAALTEVLTT